MADNFCGIRVFEMNTVFSSAVTCAVTVVQFFKTTLLNVWQSISSLMSSYTDITFETVALDRPINMAVL
jgi:hypothetical protein